MVKRYVTSRIVYMMLALHLVTAVHNKFEITIMLNNLQINEKLSHRKFIYSKRAYLPK